MANSRNRGNLREAIASKAGSLLKRPAEPMAATPASVVEPARAAVVEPAPVAVVAPPPPAAQVAVPGPLQLPTALLIGDVRGFAETLRDAVRQGDLEVDASRLADVDTAGLQLLCASRAAAVAAGHEFRWSGESQALKAAALATGLAHALGLAA
jgi:anti-anti-sigma regulatory factor